MLVERQPTDAVRAHWFALPLLRVLEGAVGRAGGVVDVHLDEGEFHVRTGERPAGAPVYGDGPADRADVRIALDAGLCLALGRGELTFTEAVKDGRITVSGDGPLAMELRGV